MADLMWPVTLIPARSELKFLDGTARSESPFDGHMQTMIRPGTKARLALRFDELRDDERRAGMSIITGLRGASGRLIVHDHTHRVAGTFAATELVPSPTMLSISGYTAGSAFAASQVGRALRMKRSQGSSSVSNVVRLTSALTVTANQPYVVRIMVHAVRGDAANLVVRAGSSAFGSEFAELTAQDPGMIEMLVIPTSTSMHVGLLQGASSGARAGDIMDVMFFSVTPCGVYDNAPNYFPASADLTNTSFWTATRASVTVTSVTLPDGSTGNANVVREDGTAGNTHLVQDGVVVPATAHDFTCVFEVLALNRTWMMFQMAESNGATLVNQFINMTTGALGTSATGAGWSNLRVTVVDKGGGWFYVRVTARKTDAAATTINNQFFVASANGTTSFNGLTQDSMAIYAPSCGISSLPMRTSLTTGTAAADGTEQALGAGQWTKGWPASTTGLIKAGSQVGVNGRKHWVLYDVDSDAAGLAQIFLSPIPNVAPDDNTPVVVNQPHGKYLLMAADPGWMTQPPGFRTNLELDLLEAI